MNGKTRYISTISRKNRGLWTVSPRSTLEFLRTRWSVSVRFRSNWNLRALVFEERKPEDSEKNLSDQGREPTTNSTHIWPVGLVWKYYGVIYKKFPENPIGKWVNGTRRFGSFQRKISGSNGISEKVVLFSGRNVTKVNSCSIVKLQFFVLV